jgi:hypothetical protein
VGEGFPEVQNPEILMGAALKKYGKYTTLILLLVIWFCGIPGTVVPIFFSLCGEIFAPLHTFLNLELF